jgi:polyphosphate:AMP phosphotransferase
MMPSKTIYPMEYELVTQEDVFHSMESAKSISRKAYDELVTHLRADLLEAQRALEATSQSVIITIGGVDGAGKGEVIQILNEWLDPRGLDTHSFWDMAANATDRPYQWRYWQSLPKRGRIAIWFGGMYTDPIDKYVHERRHPEWAKEISREIRFFENMLREDGTIQIKIWLHLTKGAQHRRLKDLYENPQEHWRAMQDDWKHHNLYEHFSEAAEQLISRTNRKESPWHVIDASIKEWRNVTVGRLLHETVLKAIKLQTSKPSKKKIAQKFSKVERDYLSEVDLDQKLDTEVYEQALITWQGRLHRLFWEAYDRNISTVLTFEGWDAAGKGSAIKRVTAAIDARLYRIVCVGAPTQEENRYHYLWRFWDPLPRAGRITIFDRSWYGRVLVERVEKFAEEKEWTRAYEEINEFEELLTSHGTVVCKFWLHISKDKQMDRFKKRLKVPYKRHKITEEDWRNREKWSQYETAVNDMIGLTNTPNAPWTIVAGNSKKFARIQILQSICRQLEQALGNSGDQS